MTVTVGLYDAGYTRLKDRIDAMGLDIEICAFDEDGNFDIGGAKVPAANAEIDYLWLGPDLAGGSLGSLPFGLVEGVQIAHMLQTRRIRVASRAAWRRASWRLLRVECAVGASERMVIADAAHVASDRAHAP